MKSWLRVNNDEHILCAVYKRFCWIIAYFNRCGINTEKWIGYFHALSAFLIYMRYGGEFCKLKGISSSNSRIPFGSTTKNEISMLEWFKKAPLSTLISILEWSIVNYSAFSISSDKFRSCLYYVGIFYFKYPTNVMNVH